MIYANFMRSLGCWAIRQDHYNAVDSWPWFARWLHRLRRCRACRYRPLHTEQPKGGDGLDNDGDGVAE